MRALLRTGLLTGVVFAAASMAWAQSPAPSPGVMTGGSDNVMINGKPAAVIGNRAGCGGAAASGARGVFINGKPMARQGDPTSGCAK